MSGKKTTDWMENEKIPTRNDSNQTIITQSGWTGVSPDWPKKEGEFHGTKKKTWKFRREKIGFQNKDVGIAGWLN